MNDELCNIVREIWFQLDREMYREKGFQDENIAKSVIFAEIFILSIHRISDISKN